MVRIAEHGTRRLVESQEDAAGMEHPIGQLCMGKRVRVKSYRIIWAQRAQLCFTFWSVRFFLLTGAFSDVHGSHGDYPLYYGGC